jgi:hypothetical protein
MATSSHHTGCIDQCSPVRNRYFYGKMLDVYHFELEQNYFNSKRWLLNRLVSGYGVVCGLNVLLSSDLKSLYVTPGVAIDKCGHEIVVCQPSVPIPLPVPAPPAQTTGSGQTPPPPPTSANNPQQPSSTATQPAGIPMIASSATPTMGNGSPANGAENCDCADYYHLMLCYHECPIDPSPSLGGDCDTRATCSPGAIRERYTLELVEDKLAAARTASALSELINGGTISYQTLATYISNISLDDPCPDCCIPLANIRVPSYGTPYDQSNDIDISVRPIVYTNDLLYEIILAMKQGPATTTARKP